MCRELFSVYSFATLSPNPVLVLVSLFGEIRLKDGGFASESSRRLAMLTNSTKLQPLPDKGRHEWKGSSHFRPSTLSPSYRLPVFSPESQQSLRPIVSRREGPCGLSDTRVHMFAPKGGNQRVTSYREAS